MRETSRIITDERADASAVNESRNISHKKPVYEIIMITVFIIYIAFLFYQTFLNPIYGRAYSHRCVNVIPFRTIGQFMSARYNRNIKIINMLGNIVVFIPLGIMLPLISKRLAGVVKGVLFSAGLSAVIEVMQYILAVGVTDIDDLILNIFGGFLGSVLFTYVFNARKGSQHLSSRSS